MKLFPMLAFAAALVPSLPAAPDDAALSAKVQALLAQMTQEEKIGQLIQYSAPGAETGPVARQGIEDDIRAGRCGSMLNVVGAKQTRMWQEMAVKNSRLHLPMLFGYDVIHGFRTIFPINLGQAASFDLPAMEHAERIAANEASAAGVHWTFAPMVDIARDPRWGRIAEGSGEDTYLGSAIARARVRGFQGDGFANADTVLACAKHFAGYGASQAGRDYSTTDIPEITLRETYLPPFHAAVEAGAATFMAAFNDLNGVPCSANHFLMTKVLREEWGFQGFVVSDWMSIRELLNHGIAADDAEACRLAMNAGLDMDMEGRIYGPQMAAQIKAGAIPQARLDAAVTAILMAKARLGLLDDPYRYCNPEREETAMLRPENLEASRALARESCVLLKNNDGVLPLARNARIALVGQLAGVKRDLLGAWQGQGKEKDAVGIREAFEAAFPNRVKYVEGCKAFGGDQSGFPAAVAAAKEADVVVAVMGEGWYMSGEAASRANIDLPGHQLELLRALRETGKPIILVLMAGRPLTLAPVLEQVDALLLAWFPGTMGGPAIADLVSGAFTPSGKLPVTFPRVVGQIPIFYNQKNTGRPLDSAPEDKFRTRYLDVLNTPQFPFGFGLSYTTFTYSQPKLSQRTLRPDGEQKVSITVTNAGEREGTEVVQLYVRDVAGSVTRPVRELKGFARVALKPSQSREVTFTLRPADLAFVHADMSVAPEAGKFEVFVGGDSTAPKVGEFVYAEPAK
jgi:beta-glucosidase